VMPPLRRHSHQRSLPACKNEPYSQNQMKPLGVSWARSKPPNNPLATRQWIQCVHGQRASLLGEHGIRPMCENVPKSHNSIPEPSMELVSASKAAKLEHQGQDNKHTVPQKIQRDKRQWMRRFELVLHGSRSSSATRHKGLQGSLLSTQRP
jgi:hypothetical protein